MRGNGLDTGWAVLGAGGAACCDAGETQGYARFEGIPSSRDHGGGMFAPCLWMNAYRALYSSVDMAVLG